MKKENKKEKEEAKRRGDGGLFILHTWVPAT